MTCSKSGFKIPLQYSICYTALESSLTTLCMTLLDVLSGWSGSCHSFRVLL